MKPISKTISYIKRMITMKKWTDSLPSLSKIAKSVSVSTGTVRNAVKILETQRVVENNGALGYTIIPSRFENLYKKDKKLYYLGILNRNIEVADMLDKGGKIIGNFVFLGDKHKLIVINAITGAKVQTSLSELRAMSDSPVTVKEMLDLNGSSLRKAKSKYKRQKKLLDMKDLVFRHRRELGL